MRPARISLRVTHFILQAPSREQAIARLGACNMKWVTRKDIRAGRIACAWLIRRFLIRR